MVLGSILLLFTTFNSCKEKSQNKKPARTMMEILFVKPAASVCLREGPDQNSDVIKVLSQGTDVLIIEESEKIVKIGNVEGKWVKVTGSHEGWVFGPLLGEGKFYQDYFLYHSCEEFKGFAIKYNYEFINILNSSVNREKDRDFQITPLDPGSFNPELPVNPGDKVVLITDKNEILYDMVKSIKLVGSYESAYLMFDLKSSNGRRGICISEKKAGAVKPEILHPLHVNVSDDKYEQLYGEIVNMLIKKPAELAFYDFVDDKIRNEYKKDPSLFIKTNHYVDIESINVSGSLYYIAAVKNKNRDLDYYDMLIILKDDRIIYKKNGRMNHFFGLGGRLLIQSDEWTPHTGYHIIALTEISDEAKTLNYLYVGD